MLGANAADQENSIVEVHNLCYIGLCGLT